MIKYYCDACGKEKEDLWPFSYRCHLSSKGRVDSYIDNEGNGISGRDDSVELCPKCYNRAVSKAVNEIRKIQEDLGLEPIDKTYH